MQYHKKPLERVLFPGCGENFSTASYLTEATTVIKEKGLFKEELMKHISPLGWEHINFVGEYSFDISKTTNIKALRPLTI